MALSFSGIQNPLSALIAISPQQLAVNYRRTGSQKVLTKSTESILDLTFSSDGKTLASGNDDGTVLLWDLHNISF
ncbi:MAG: WD40 repeat domain-containing protein [Candidatus Poribacteria bacterium]|nr:WD40 repeat domain-containing protein [Candidatus Poribacteria bacterium]